MKRKYVWLAVVCGLLGCAERPFQGKQETGVVASSAKNNPAPKILGAREGVAQVPYAQETKYYRQSIRDEVGKARFQITPFDSAGLLDFSKVPTIYRWWPRIDDEAMAPSYSIKVVDEDDVVKVTYAISCGCKPREQADREVLKNSQGTYEIKLIQSKADFDLSRDSSESQNGKTYCLSIWAVDSANNATNHKVEFIWKVTMPPIGIDMNSGRYKAHRREDDISWVGPPVWELFRKDNPIALKRDVVVGHAIMANPFSSPIMAQMKLSKAMELTVNNRRIQVPEHLITVKYFVYDLDNNGVGPEKDLSDAAVLVNGHEAILAKFILVDDIAIAGVSRPDAAFWRTFWMAVGFAKEGREVPYVDGLALITRDAGSGGLSGEFKVPWGDDHELRRRSAPRHGTAR